MWKYADVSLLAVFFFLSGFCSLLYQVGLWIFSGVMNVDAVTAAILGLSILLITGVVTWKECLAEAVAWDTLTWFAALIAMAGYLNKYGLISWFSQTVVKVCFLFLLLKIFRCRPFRNYASNCWIFIACFGNVSNYLVIVVFMVVFPEYFFCRFSLSFF